MSWLDFIRHVRDLGGTHAVMAEYYEDVHHVTTFVTKSTEALRCQIHVLESQLIDHYPDLRFDFHIREADPTSESWLKFTLECEDMSIG